MSRTQPALFAASLPGVPNAGGRLETSSLEVPAKSQAQMFLLYNVLDKNGKYLSITVKSRLKACPSLSDLGVMISRPHTGSFPLGECLPCGDWPVPELEAPTSGAPGHCCRQTRQAAVPESIVGTLGNWCLPTLSVHLSQLSQKVLVEGMGGSGFDSSPGAHQAEDLWCM